MIMQDKMEKERADAKNAVEEYVYEMRDKLSSALSEFMTEAVRSFPFYLKANHALLSLVIVFCINLLCFDNRTLQFAIFALFVLCNWLRCKILQRFVFCSFYNVLS